MLSHQPNKPLLRWVIGGVIPQGLYVLKESIGRTINLFGDRFDYMVCHNNLSPGELDFVPRLFPSVSVMAQDWFDCAIPDKHDTPKRADGTVREDTHNCGGSLWKLCPARLRPEAHEIVMDNDIVLTRAFPKIEKFLGSDRPLLLKEPMRFYGRYGFLFPADKNYNSGFVGLPPGFDYASKLREAWREHGLFCNLTYGDEQGLITYVLSKADPIFIETNEIVELHQLGRSYYFNGSQCFKRHTFTAGDFGLHFVQANRNNPHEPWCQYKNGSIKLI